MSEIEKKLAEHKKEINQYYGVNSDTIIKVKLNNFGENILSLRHPIALGSEDEKGYYTFSFRFFLELFGGYDMTQYTDEALRIFPHIKI